VPLSVYLVDDHAPYRRCVRQALEAARLHVAGEAAGGEPALQAARACAPHPLADVVLLDVLMPGLHGVALLPQLLALAPASRIVMLSLHDDPVLVRTLLHAGATACLAKHAPLAMLLTAIRNAAGRA
jgi:DNA-binding NarL/FixJ family response regulator